MIVKNVKEVEQKKIEKFPFKGEMYKVREVWVQWLSSGGPAESPDYGLRFFRIGPGGEIPIHNHFYLQTMFILTGRAQVLAQDLETDKVLVQREVGPNDFVFVSSMEPHAMKNLSDTEEVTFLCCIANVFDDENV